MKNLVVSFLIIGIFITSCNENKKHEIVEQQKNTGKDVKEDISFKIQNISEQVELLQKNTANKSTAAKVDKKKLDLPDDFINRDFLENSVGYKDKLDYLVGTVVKKSIKNGDEKYNVVLDFIIDSVNVSARVPANGILVEKKYDYTVGIGIQYLVASAQVDRNSAYQLLISDVSEITIPGKAINKAAIYNTYANDSEINNYYVVRAAVTTSIMYKKFVKMSAKAEFNAAAIKVGANYYSESSELKQDWKIGLQLTPVKEFIKGYKPDNQ
jgi:hypothetical protein